MVGWGSLGGAAGAGAGAAAGGAGNGTSGSNGRPPLVEVGEGAGAGTAPPSLEQMPGHIASPTAPGKTHSDALSSAFGVKPKSGAGGGFMAKLASMKKGEGVGQPGTPGIPTDNAQLNKVAALLGSKNTGLEALRKKNEESKQGLDMATAFTRVKPNHGADDESMRDLIKTQIDNQREGRRGGGVMIRRKGDRDVSNNNAQEKVGANKWLRARTLLKSKGESVHLSGVNPDAWVDINQLFYYYNDIYFEGKLDGITFSWINQEDDDADFRYCLCSEVPLWWHGPRKHLCAGISCRNERNRGGGLYRSVHIQLPESIRRFKLTHMAKEALLHQMVHAYIFMQGMLLPDEAFYEHTKTFKQLMHRLNTDYLTFDAYRPAQGYKIIFSDAEEVEEEEVRLQEQIDAFTDEHYKLLYLTSRYSHVAERAEDKEVYVRQLALLVLIYEGIVEKVFEYDYAPASYFVAGRRIYMNITQEGRDNVDDLVEAKLVRALRQVDRDNQPVVAYQCTVEGHELLRQGKCSKDDRRAVDDLIFTDSESLLFVEYRPDKQLFVLRSEDNSVMKDSEVTECEDVSYVTSPYLPYTLRDLTKMMTSNAHRAHESAAAKSNIQDELDVNVTLSRVVVLVGEWIPFGCNQIMEMSMKLGVRDRIKGGYFSSIPDNDSTGTHLQLPTGLTHVSVNSYNEAHFLNIEAEVDFPEDEGIVQVEHFGLRYQRDGATFYGLKVESVMEEVVNDISIDYLSRLIADIHIDSSKVTDSLISERQRQLLDMVYAGNADSRDKVNVFIAEKIDPKMRAQKYLDGDALECEIRQIIGDTYHAFDITDNDFVIFGSHGVLFAGPDCFRHEALLLSFLSLQARELFMVNFFNRLFVINDTMKMYRSAINRFMSDPNSIPRIREGLLEVYDDVILLEEMLLHFQLSLRCDEPDARAVEQKDYPTTPEGQRLFHVLQIEPIFKSLRQRASDCTKHLDASKNEISFLQTQIGNCAAQVLSTVRNETSTTFLDCSQQMKINENSSNSLSIMQIIFTGSLAFQSIDRMTGEWSVLDQAWARGSVNYALIFSPNLYWFFMSLVFWLVVGIVILRTLRFMANQVLGLVAFHSRINKPIVLRNLVAWLSTKGIVSEDVEASGSSVLHNFTWTDENRRYWERYAPMIQLKVDMKHEFVHEAIIFVEKPANQPARLFPRELQDKLITEMERANVFDTAVVKRMELAEKQGRYGDVWAGTRNRAVAKDKVENVFYAIRGESLQQETTSGGGVLRREVVIEHATIAQLRERVALKFCYQKEAITELKYVRMIDNEEVDELLEADEQVVMLPYHTLLVVSFKGKPDPNLSIFARQMQAIKDKEGPAGSKKVDFSKMKKAAAKIGGM